MALHPNFPHSPHAILDPAIRWFPADETLRSASFEKGTIAAAGSYPAKKGERVA